jgi:DNA-binding MarR family transcriptional regulator
MGKRTDTTGRAPNDRQRRDLLDALADDTLSAVVAVLLRGVATQTELQDRTGVDQSGMSRALKHLRALGLVSSGRGRSAEHAIGLRREVFAVLKAADLLARAVNDARDNAQRETAQRTMLDELGDVAPGAAEGAAGA